MRTIKTITGIRKIEDSSTNTLLFEVREIFTQHRAALIHRIIPELYTYLDYTFNHKATKEQLITVREKLFELANSTVMMDRYDSLFQQILQNEKTNLDSQEFFKEINEVIHYELFPMQLKLVV